MPDGRWLDGVLYDDMHDSAGLPRTHDYYTAGLQLNT